MGLFVFGAVTGVGECLVAAVVLAGEGLLSCVTPVVDLEIFQSSEAPCAAGVL